MDNITQARKARALAQAQGKSVGFQARIMEAGGNLTCIELGHQADAELTQRDLVRRKELWAAQSEADQLRNTIARLQSKLERQDREIAELKEHLEAS